MSKTRQIKKRSVSFISGYDNKTYTVMNPEHGTVAEWKRGVCWSAWCGNPIFYVHISNSGKATHGYCPHVRELYQFWPRGTWFMLQGGKLVKVRSPK